MASLSSKTSDAAEDHLPSTHQLPSSSSALIFSVRFADGAQGDLHGIWVGEKETIRDLKKRIRLLRPELALNKLKLIYLGRLLSNGTLIVPYVRSFLRHQSNNWQGSGMAGVSEALGEAVSGAVRGAEGLARTVGAAFADEGILNGHNGITVFAEDGLRHANSQHADASKGGKGKGNQSNDNNETIWLQCAIGEQVDASQADELDAESLSTSHSGQIQPLRGFDRLVEAGLSEDDIRSVRLQFHAERNPVSLSVVQEEDDEHARVLEERWLDSLNPAEEPSASSDQINIYTNLLRGACVGFLFPIIPLFWFRTEVMDRRTQLAHCLGLAMNLAFGALRYMTAQ